MDEDVLDTIITWQLRGKNNWHSKPITNYNLVLDLDECLVRTFNDVDKLKSLGIFKDPDLLHLRKRTYRDVIYSLDTPGEPDITDIWGVTRPHLYEFLLFSSAYFENIFIWSSGKYDYVHAIVKHIFRDLPKPRGVLTNDDCDVYDKDKLYKPLTWLYEKYKDLNIKPEDTIMLDDFAVNVRSNPQNAIIVPSYAPKMNVKSLCADDTCFYDIMAWLKSEEVLDAEDIRKVKKPL
jgi:hypothetical protein